MTQKNKVFNVSNFSKRTYLYLKFHKREELVPVFEKLLSKVPNHLEKDEDSFRQWFMEQLQTNLNFTKKQSSKMFGHIQISRYKKLTGGRPVLGKERFKFVLNPKPFQGGSPGLGKKK